MSKQPARLRILIVNAIAAILIILVFGLTASYAKMPQPSPFLSPTGGLPPRAYLPLIAKNFPPPLASTSYYVKDPTQLNNLGCAQGFAIPDNTDIVVVLDVGQPGYDGANFGAFGWDSPTYTFHSTIAIANEAEDFLSGFYYCSLPYAHLTLAIGVNNVGNWINNAHGVAWAQMVNNVNSWINSDAYLRNKVTARGGMDIEQTPPFQTPGFTRSWVDGYISAFSFPSYYYDFGSCDGCPSVAPCPTCILNQYWTIEDVWYVSFGPAALPLPDIYNSTHAAQWYQMSLYSFTHKGYRMAVLGSLTEYSACQQRGNCAGIDNTPSIGWGELYDALNGDPNTAQSLSWSTDISWQGEPIRYPNP